MAEVSSASDMTVAIFAAFFLEASDVFSFAFMSRLSEASRALRFVYVWDAL